MKIHEFRLLSGVPKQIGRGRYVRLLEAQGKLEIVTQTLGDKANQNGELIENVGAEFYKFESAQLLSDIDQNIKIAVSELPIFDNRVGNNSSAALITKQLGSSNYSVMNKKVYKDRQTANNNGLSNEVLRSNRERIKALIYFPEPVFVRVYGWDAGVGFPLPAGYYEHECVAGLYAELQDKSNNNAVVVNVIDYIRN